MSASPNRSGQAQPPIRDQEGVAFLQWALPQLAMRWPGFRRVRRQVYKRLRRRLDALGVQQYDLFGVVSRRLQRFRKEQELLLKQEDERRDEIRSMKNVRGEAIDPIGALVLIPEGV